MIQIPFTEIVQRLVLETQLSEAEIKEKISEKMASLSGLISQEGAAHIVANELNVKLFSSSQLAKINQIREGMRNVTVAGRVKSVFPVKEFNTGQRQGRVGNVLLEDETGTIRVTLWNAIADQLSRVQTGDIIQLRSAYVRLNNLGFRELHLNERSQVIRNPPGIEIPALVQSLVQKKISELEGTESTVQMTGHVVNVFDPRFFEQCPECRKRVTLREEGKFTCEIHGQVEPRYGYVVNLLVDDGTGTLRVTCWKEQADVLFGNLDVVYESPQLFDTLKNEVLGHIVKVTGAVKRNELSSNLELTAKMIEKDTSVQLSNSQKNTENSTTSEEELVE